MRLRVGEIVVYASHGVGRIVAVDKRLVGDAEQTVVVVELSEGLTVSLPRDRAQEQLRAPVNNDELLLVQKALRQEPVVSDKPWLSRQRDALAKLTSGGAVELAEIVRDAAARSSTATGSGKSGTAGERDVAMKARLLLAIEISHVLGVGTAEADGWIEEQVGHR